MTDQASPSQARHSCIATCHEHGRSLKAEASVPHVFRVSVVVVPVVIFQVLPVVAWILLFLRVTTRLARATSLLHVLPFSCAIELISNIPKVVRVVILRPVVAPIPYLLSLR